MLGAVALSACVGFAWRAARWIYPAGALHLRVAASLTVALASAVAGANLLDALGAFTIPGAALWWGGLGVTALRLGSSGGEDIERVRSWFRAQSRHPVELALKVTAIALIAWRGLRGLSTPPLAWDSLTYHLFRPARMVQRGADLVEALPDQWGYLEFFPRGGDLPWAWMLLWSRSDTLLAPTGIALLLGVALAAACMAKALGASDRQSGLAAALVATIPAAMNISTSGYADNFVLLASLLAGTFLLRLGARLDGRDAALGLTALAIGASAKLSGLPGFALGALIVAGRYIAARERPRGAHLLAALAASAAVLAPGYLRTYRATGSLSWPLSITVAGRTIMRGNEELTMLYAGAFHPPGDGAGSFERLLHALVDPKPEHPFERLDWGPGTILMAPIALAALARLARPRPTRYGLGASIALAALPLVGLMSPSFITLRTIWISVLGRLIVAVPALLAVLAATERASAARMACAFALALHLGADWPITPGPTVREAMLATAPLAAAGVAWLSVVALLSLRLRRSFVLAAGLAVSAAVGVPALDALRARHRYALYRAAVFAAESGAYELHPLVPQFVSAWPIWRRLDDGPAHRVAISLGWEGIGHNGFRYPLLGSSLQNTLSYVPVTNDGEVIDHRRDGELRARASADAWLRRIDAGGFDHLVLLHPFPMERAWVLSRPRRFELALRTPDGLHELWRIRR